MKITRKTPAQKRAAAATAARKRARLATINDVRSSYYSARSEHNTDQPTGSITKKVKKALALAVRNVRHNAPIAVTSHASKISTINGVPHKRNSAGYLVPLTPVITFLNAKIK